MAKVKFSHSLTAKKEEQYITAGEPVELSEDRANEIVENIKRDFGVDVEVEIIEPDQKDDDAQEEGNEGDQADEVDLSTLEAAELKEIADERGIKYNNNASADQMRKLLEEGNEEE